MAAAQTIATSVLLDHIRLGSYAEAGQFSCKMVTELIDHLRVVVNKSCLQPKSPPDPPTKRMRGRPRRKAASNPPDDDQRRGRITRQTKQESVSALSSLLEGPSFTLSPTKLGQKVDRLSFPMKIVTF